MKKRIVKGGLLLLVVFLGLVALKGWKLETKRNTKVLEEALASGSDQLEGSWADLFDLDYEQVYVFAPYQSKEEMEEELGFTSRLLKETTSEGMMNIAFVKDQVLVAYLYGYAYRQGYYLALPVGVYEKKDLETKEYQAQLLDQGNSSGSEEKYWDYRLKGKE